MEDPNIIMQVKDIGRLREGEKEKQQIWNSVPQQRSCQVSTVNVVKSALEHPQEKGAKKCTMVVICFLKAKYHILKATNARVQKGLGTKRESLPAKPKQNRTGETYYLHLLCN